MAKITIEELSSSLKEYLNGLGLTEEQVQELIDKFEDEKIGDISQLSAEEKGSLVGAINENANNINILNNNIKSILYVTNENYKECILEMKDGYTFLVIEDLIIEENIIFSNLNNIKFKSNFKITLHDTFTSDNKSIIKFDSCNNVEFECKELDIENKTLFDADGMNFIVLFTDCENVDVINTKISNGINITGLSSSINGVNSKKVGKNLRIDNLLIKNCRSAVFTQYTGNTIENIKAYNTNDAIIALNSENCKNSYINNCYGEYNDSFPLVAVENCAINVNVNNCIARNTRGLFELFSIEDSYVDSFQPQRSTVNISNSVHIIDDDSFTFNSSVTLTTLSFRRGVEKYTNINIDKVDCYNTTETKSNYIYVADTNLNSNVIKNFNITNSNIFINTINQYIILFNASVKNLTLKNSKFEGTYGNNNWCLRHTSDSITIDNMVIENCIIDGFTKALSADFTYNDFITSFTMKNTRFYNSEAACFNYPNGNLFNNDYNKGMLLNDYILSNRGCSRVIYERSQQPPTVGSWFAGDIAINKFNHEEYYYDGTSWVKRQFVSE